MFSNPSESLGVLVGDQLVSVESHLNLPPVDSLFGATARLFDVVDGDDDFACLLAPGDPVLHQSNVVVEAVFVDGKFPGSDSVGDLLARAGFVVDLYDSLSCLLADSPAAIPDLESVVVVALHLNSKDAELRIVLLDAGLPLLDVLLRAAARSVLDDDDLSSCLRAPDDPGPEDVFVSHESLDLDALIQEVDPGVSCSWRESWV